MSQSPHKRKTSRRTRAGAPALDDSRRRYKHAWDDSFRYERANWAPRRAIDEGLVPERRRATHWNTIRRFSHSRSGKTVILAPVFGALGALLFYRRRP